ncbi:hypothetical protein LXL04_033623 [Taraxacum kok-saghyz]
MSHDLKSLAHQIEEFQPGIIEKHERYNTLTLCYLHKLLKFDGFCNESKSVMNFLLGISRSAQSTITNLDSERIKKQTEALDALETAHKMKPEDADFLYHLSLEYAE